MSDADAVRAMNVDLHCHSTVSDGWLAPGDVVRRAARNGVEVLALTDHDEVSGIDEARAVAAVEGLRLVNGVEISVTASRFRCRSRARPCTSWAWGWITAIRSCWPA